MRPRFTRDGFPRKRHLFAGPWVGEFGWELMNWQGLIRALRPHYEHVTVCSRAQSSALYDDCCDEFVPHAVQGQPNAHVVFDIENPDELDRVFSCIPPGADNLIPLRYVPASAQSLIRFGNRAAVADSADVLIHARGNPRVADRNWSAKKWRKLVEGLQKNGLKVGAFGLSRSTLDVSGVEDYRNIPLEETMDRLACARLAVGPSSGPMHLASLCGTPHLVWTDRRTYGMGKTSREKYETWWNPLGTPVHVMDEYGFDPTVDAVLMQIEKSLQREKYRL